MQESNNLDKVAASSALIGVLTWNPYSGYGAILLALILLAIGTGIFAIGSRMKNPIKLPKISLKISIVIIIIWILSILLLVRISAGVSSGGKSALASLGPILPITLGTAILSFAIITYLSRKSGILAAIRDGFLGLCAGPMVFELPYIFIIAPMVNNVGIVSEAKILFTIFVIICTTFALLTFCKRASINRLSIYMLGLMFIVFGAWALFAGFSYPSTLVPFMLNAISKVLGFAVIVAMFIGNEKKR